MKKSNTSMKMVLLIAILFLGYILLKSYGNKKEGFEGSSLNYHMSDGISSSWEHPAEKYNMFRSLENNTGGPVPLAEGELLIFKENKFDPKCCPSVYSNSTGCVCATPEQMNYLNQRGGNRTFSSTY